MKMHITWGPGVKDMSPEEIQAAEAEHLALAAKMSSEREAAARALEGLPHAAVPLDQLASIYKRFLRLTRLGQSTIDGWQGMSDAERVLRREVFNQADFGAVFAGQWLPKELRQSIRDLVKGKRYDHNFDQHEVAYHRHRMDEMISHPRCP